MGYCSLQRTHNKPPSPKRKKIQTDRKQGMLPVTNDVFFLMNFNSIGKNVAAPFCFKKKRSIKWMIRSHRVHLFVALSPDWL
jgi:hypothetical protein